MEHASAKGNKVLTKQQANRFTLCLSLMFCASIFYLSLLPITGHTADKTMPNKTIDSKNQLKTLQQGIEEKEKSVKQQEQQRNTLLGRLKQQENSIALVSRTLRETQSTLKQLDKNIADITISIDDLKNQQATQQHLLAKQLNTAFKQRKNSGLRIILNGEKSQRNERILAYFNYINQARETSISKLQQISTSLKEQKSSLLQKQNQQSVLLNKQKNQQQKLEYTRTARKQTLTSLEASLKKDQQSLAELKLNEKRLRNKIVKAERRAKARAKREEQEAARVRAQIKTKKQQAEKSGSKYTPSESERSLMARTGGLGQPNGQAIWPVHGHLSHRFGEALQGELRWKGMVIAAAEGSEVKAIADGRVLLADWLQGYGLVVVVEHGKGDMSLYGYNQSALVNIGEQVKAGQPVALVGNSGGQGTPSLYFEIRRQGQAVNPLPWLGR
ncbi:murein hydrolase activator EnvC [Candidatus Fukatsuia symbiotica]